MAAGGGAAYTGVELRKLPPRFRIKLAQILDEQEDWKRLMSSIPSEINPNFQKYRPEHITLIERHSQKALKPCGEILLDEWSTSGKVRPTVETLLYLLIKCQLFRAADYVATEILNVPPPERPTKGPCATVVPSPLSRLTYPDKEAEDQLPQEYKNILEKLNNHDYEKGSPISFNISLIESTTRNFSKDFCIGSGAFGTVYKVNLRKLGGPELAIKLLNEDMSVVEEQFLTEIRVLSEYRHENLVPLIGFCTNGPQYCLVYEYVPKGSLLDAIACLQERAALIWSRRLTIMYGIAKGLHFLHTGKERPLVHRDVKSANVLLDDRLVPKIGDFGLAKYLSSSTQTSVMTSTIFGTSAYMAPEAFRGDISPKMDIFSFGVIILELLTGLPPFDEDRDGNDLVTYLEQSIEDDSNLAFHLDRKGQIYSIDEALIIYKLAQRCLDDKRRRPTSALVIRDLKDVLNLKTLVDSD